MTPEPKRSAESDDYYDRADFYPDPRMTYRMTRKQAKAVLLRCAPPYFHGGTTWVVKTKHAGLGVYDVWCVERRATAQESERG